MAALPEVDDLSLVVQIAESGSIGGAARALHLAQPSASSRLAALERRLGVVLFERDTSGARPTRAGLEMVREGRHILAHLEGVHARVTAAGAPQRVRVGTFASLAGPLFASVEQLLDAPVAASVGHGPDLVRQVAEGTLDAAVVAVAHHMDLPRQVRVSTLGDDELSVVRSKEVPGRARGARPYRDRRMVVATYDDSGPAVRERLARLGADAETAPTLPTALALARRRSALAVVPRSALAHQLGDDEVLEPLPFRHTVQLQLVTGPRPPAVLTARSRALGRALHLRRPRESD